MQKLNGYIETPYLAVLYSPSTSTVNRSKIVYARPLKLYRGINNTMQLRLLDNDQKAVDITGKTFVFNIVDPTTHLVIKNKTGVIANATQGKVDFTFTSTDLSSAYAGKLKYSIHEEDGLGNRTRIVYSDDDYGADGVLQMFDSPYVGFSASQTATFSTMTASTTDDNSNYVVAHEHLNADSVHTVQYFFDTAYTGRVTIQVTLAEDPSSLLDSDWTEQSYEDFTAKTGSHSVTFPGNYTAVRFKSTKTAGTIEKVLYRP